MIRQQPWWNEVMFSKQYYSCQCWLLTSAINLLVPVLYCLFDMFYSPLPHCCLSPSHVGPTVSVGKASRAPWSPVCVCHKYWIEAIATKNKDILLPLSTWSLFTLEAPPPSAASPLDTSGPADITLHTSFKTLPYIPKTAAFWVMMRCRLSWQQKKWGEMASHRKGLIWSLSSAGPPRWSFPIVMWSKE